MSFSSVRSVPEAAMLKHCRFVTCTIVVHSPSRPCRAEMFHHGDYNPCARADSDQLRSILQRHNARASGREASARVGGKPVVYIVCVRVPSLMFAPPPLPPLSRGALNGGPSSPVSPLVSHRCACSLACEGRTFHHASCMLLVCLSPPFLPVDTPSM